MGETKKGPTACSSVVPLPYLIVPLFVLSSIKWYNNETPGRVRSSLAHTVEGIPDHFSAQKRLTIMSSKDWSAKCKEGTADGRPEENIFC